MLTRPHHVLVLLGAIAAAAHAAQPPIIWHAPESFDPNAAGLGLPQLPGVTIETLYDPNEVREDMRGWYNHHPSILLYHDYVIVGWTNHIYDENGAGQVEMARFGKIDRSTGEVRWNPRLVRCTPPPVTPARRGEASNPDVIDGVYALGGFVIIDGRLYLRGLLTAYDGWTDDVRYHAQQSDPIPADHYSNARVRATGFRFDIRRDLGMRYIQAWEMTDDDLRPSSPLYAIEPPVDSVEVTPGFFKPVAPLDAYFRDAPPISEAPQHIQAAADAQPDITFKREPHYAPGTKRLTDDGTNGLAHWTEFRRPDGSWVAVRDNLVNRGRYYAAEKPDHDAPYPPATRTNLFGDVMAAAGELPDGRVWLIGNDGRRQHLYITVSDDGIHFDCTWLLHQAAMDHVPGLGKSSQPDGPQYPHAILLDHVIIMVFSVSKQNIAFMTIPVDAMK